ncbi:hybrid sensor histidine kinase/response regulator [Desulfovibrio inopinatus]|uniref:hybrid sensor histidine kinase/response regulator n=1 Tax=Desulfovibrio inopinatus TaxID=102109 RepID=UPI000423AE5D|nr:ATP-binding protein [Desulfovibrio inopinatus]
MKSTRIKQTFFFLVAGLFVLTCVSLALLFIFLFNEFKKESAPLLHKQMNEQASKHFLRVTKSKSRAYNAVLGRIERSSVFLARKIAEDLTRVEDGTMSVATFPHLIQQAQNGIYSSIQDDRITALYWGGSIMNAATRRELAVMMQQADLFENAKKTNVGVCAVWFIGESGTALYYPQSDAVSHLRSPSQIDYRKSSYYLYASPSQNPQGRARWTSVYFDPVGHGSVVSVVVPVMQSNERFMGVVGIDIKINEVMTHVNHSAPGVPMEDFLLDKNGTIILLPEWLAREWELPVVSVDEKHSREEMGPSMLYASDEAVRQAGREMLVRSSGILRLDFKTSKYITAFTHLYTTDWVLGSTMLQETALAPLTGLETEFYRIRFWLSWVVPLVIGLLLIGLLWIFLKFIHRYFEKPLSAILSDISRIKQGEVPSVPAVTSHDELGRLSAAICQLATTLEADRELLDRTQREYQRIFEELPVGMFRSTMDGEILDVNPALVKLVGYEDIPSFLQNVENMKELYLDPEERQKFLVALVARGQADDIDGVFRHRDGESLPIIRAARLTAGDDGQPVIEGVIYDAAQRNQRRDIQKELARIEAASQTKTMFLASLSHELRTPLNALLGGVDILYDTSLSPKQSWTLSLMRESAQMLVQLVDELLDYSRLEAGKIMLKKEIIDIQDVARSALGSFAEKARKKGIEARFIVTGLLNNMRVGDPENIRKVLVILLDNAFKFTVRGSVELLLEESSRTSTVHIRITDTGPGIPENQKKRILDYFTQADPSAFSSVDSPGVGLTLVRKLVFLMNGNVTIESEEGKGTQVHVSLPLASSAALDERTDTVSQDLASLSGRILAVDDYAFGHTVLGQYLEGSRIMMDTASSGEEAIALAARNQYDLILMDWEMPKIDGFEAARIIRDEEERTRRSATPLVVMAAYDMNPMAMHGAQHLFDAHLSKPVSRKAFASVLKQFLNNSAESSSRASSS